MTKNRLSCVQAHLFLLVKTSSLWPQALSVWPKNLPRGRRHFLLRLKPLVLAVSTYLWPKIPPLAAGASVSPKAIYASRVESSVRKYSWPQHISAIYVCVFVVSPKFRHVRCITMRYPPGESS